MAAAADVLKQFEVALDISRSISNREFTVVEGDTGNVLHITLTDNGEPVDLTGCRVLAVFSKSTGTSSQDSGLENGGVTIGGKPCNEVTIQLFTSSVAPGMVECELQVYSGEGNTTLVTSAKFNFTCRRGILNDDTVQATQEYPLLMGLLEQARKATDAANAAADAAYQAAKAAGLLDHASRHAAGGADPVSPASIGAAAEAHTHGSLRFTSVSNPGTISKLREVLDGFLQENSVSGSGIYSGICISMDRAWVPYWNAENTTAEIGSGSRYVFHLMTGFADNTYCALLVSSYNTDRPLYFIRKFNGEWSRAYKLMLDDETQPIDLRFTNKSVPASAWEADATYNGYNYRAAITGLTGVTPSMFAQVVINVIDARSGNFAPISVTGTDQVYIYAKTKPTANTTIPTINVSR